MSTCWVRVRVRVKVLGKVLKARAEGAYNCLSKEVIEVGLG